MCLACLRRARRRSLGSGCTARNPAFDARIEDSRAENQEEPLSHADAETFLSRRCPGFHHWRDLARFASANIFRFIAFEWTGSCVTQKRAVAEQSARERPERRFVSRGGAGAYLATRPERNLMSGKL